MFLNSIKQTAGRLIWDVIQLKRALLKKENRKRLSDKLNRLIRLSKLETWRKGHYFPLCFDKIEIDITVACDLKCFNCIRSCRQAPSEEHMTIEQIERFVGESIEREIRWKLIKIIGGEPTLHPQLETIISILKAYREKFSTETKIELWTNGFARRLEVLSPSLLQDITVVNDKKTGVVQSFLIFNIAPADCPEYWLTDFSNGCGVPGDCGFGLTRHGFYACPNAGGIDRVFGFHSGFKNIPDCEKSLRDQLKKICRYCGHFRLYPEAKTSVVRTEKEIMSPSWRRAYREYREKPPVLTSY